LKNNGVFKRILSISKGAQKMVVGAPDHHICAIWHTYFFNQ
jgi:hypothetical protein